MKKPLLFFIVPLALVMGVYSALMIFDPPPIKLQAATWLGEQARPLPAFSMTDHNQQPFDNQSIQGKWQLLFFGYTHCPDICPDTLQVLADAYDSIYDLTAKDSLQIVFVSIDPERDSLSRMKAYVEHFHKGFLSARSSLPELQPLTQALGIHHSVEIVADGKVQVEHSGVLILVDPQGRFSGLFSSPHNAEEIAHDLVALIKGRT